jgi:hypothetical protein
MKKYTRKRKIKGGFETPKKKVKFASLPRTSDDESRKQLFPEMGVDRGRSLMRNSIQPHRDRHDYGQFDEKDFLPPPPERGRRPDRNSIQPHRDRHDYGQFDEKDFLPPKPPLPSPSSQKGGKSVRSSNKRKTIRRKRNVKK